MSGWAFLVLLAVVLGPCHLYLWLRLVRDTTRSKRARWLGAALFVFPVGALLVAFSARVRDYVDLPQLPGQMWVALLLYLVLFLLVLELPRLVFRRRFVREDDSRRLLLGRATAVAAGVMAVSTVGLGVKSALGPPVLKRVQIPLAKLPRRLDGYRIAVVADIHLGKLTSVAHTQRIVDAINGMDADLIAVVGDLVDGQVDELRDQAEPLRHLHSRDGAYFVTGNHDYYSGVEPWINHIRELGLHPLRNERVHLHGIELAGTDDITGNSDVGAALKGRDPALPVILLAHQPVVVHEAARHGVDLQLSGHTHGGQMVPLNLLARAYQPVISGLANVDGTTIYVTNGAGFWGPPVRVGAPPDVTLVELRSPA